MRMWIPALLSLSVLGGCTTVQRGSIPVVDKTGSASELEQPETGFAGSTAAPSAIEQGDAVVVVPQAVSSAPIQSLPLESTPLGPGETLAAPSADAAGMPALSGIPRSGLAADEQLDGPVLALLTTARQQQDGGDLNGAASSLERAQRIAPREPQVLYRLAEVRLAQGDATQAEQLARRGLSYASGRPALQAGLWELIAQSRERLGDPSGAAQARQNARVNL